MKTSKLIAGILLTAALALVSSSVRAEGTNAAALKPDTLTTCPVSAEKLGEMAPPYVFDYKGQEVKLCCKMCKADFDKDPAKYLKKIQDAQAAAKK